MNAIRKPVTATAGARRIETRELAALRSNFDARRFAEAAAGKRRFVIFLLSALLLVGFGGLSLASLMSPWWLFLPGTLIVSNIVGSRYAVLQSERADVIYKERIAELKGLARPVVKHTVVPEKKRDIPSRPIPTLATADVLDGAESSGLVASANDESAVVDDTPEVEITSESESVEWQVPSVPAPAYLRQEKVTRLSIHVDTDIFGIPQVSAATPARPVAASPLPKESAPTTFSFDLNAVLEARRAQ